MTKADPVRVLILCRDPALGGAAASLHRLAGALPDFILTSFLTVGRRHGEVGGLETLRRMVQDARALIRKVSEHQFDVVQLNPSLGWRSLVRETLHALVLRRFAPQQRALLFFRGWDWAVADIVARSPWRERTFCSIFGPPFHSVTLGRIFAQWLQARGFPPDTIHQSTTNFDDRLLPATVAERTPLPDRRTILFLGRLVPAKGADLALAAFRLIANDHPDLRLILAGEGTERSRLRQASHDLIESGRVTLPGHLSGSAKITALADAVIFLLPTRHGEGMPNALLEAMAVGAIPVVSAAGAMGEILEPDVTAILINELTAEGVAAAMRQALSRIGMFESTRTRRVAGAFDQFAVSRVAQRMVDIYRAVAA